MAISRLDFTWGHSAFMHCMTAALNDLCLLDMGESELERQPEQEGRA